ncbi:helix-turn-helix transcriptional regulator [Planctomonas sp. JC2975]|uniref:helix-turn-helix domain-containing protein n=1 Tax=Planctomonas sp. JC2975 TaxID=2729626 RepID=UPI001473C2BC|nr:AraC family transcriptional regulator [Planctomonas sp. JC2975]NNC13576.1 helix-turn-helix transcriptional regulator [Planctomonas sp. JC2975]
MPLSSQGQSGAVKSQVWPSGGRHLWRSGGVSSVQTHDHGHLVYAATGVLTVHTSEGTSVVPANRIAWTPAGRAHQHRAHGYTDMRIVFVPLSLAARILRRPAVFLATDLAREVVLALTGPNGDDPPAYSASAQARLRRVLVDELREAQEQPLYLPVPRDDRLQALARILDERPGDNASMAELGAEVGASSRTLSRLLSNELGMTFYQWRTQLRIYHALVLLSEGNDVTQTAHDCGWSNPSAFITAFADVMGTTPGQYLGSRPR